MLPSLLTNENALNSPLYCGPCIKFDEDCTTTSIKVWYGSDWIWIDVPIKQKGRRHTVPMNKALSPTLMIGRRITLSIPFERGIELPPRKSVRKVGAAELAIKTTATASVITRDGTVVARRFFHRGADIDCRDKGLLQIRRRARQRTGITGTLGKGFCAKAYRKAINRNWEMVNDLSGQIIAFAVDHNAEAIVFEHLKQFRPKGGRKGSSLRQRFHGWLHRKLVAKAMERAEEACLRMEFVLPAGTSKYAFDGFGEVKRDFKNWSLVTFANGKCLQHRGARLRKDVGASCRKRQGMRVGQTLPNATENPGHALIPLAARAKRPGCRAGSPIDSAVTHLGGEDSQKQPRDSLAGPYGKISRF